VKCLATWTNGQLPWPVLQLSHAALPLSMVPVAATPWDHPYSPWPLGSSPECITWLHPMCPWHRANINQLAPWLVPTIETPSNHGPIASSHGLCFNYPMQSHHCPWCLFKPCHGLTLAPQWPLWGTLRHITWLHPKCPQHRPMISQLAPWLCHRHVDTTHGSYQPLKCLTTWTNRKIPWSVLQPSHVPLPMSMVLLS
jgi:hypothetical protein